MSEDGSSRRLSYLLIFALLLVFGGDLLASIVQTAGNTVEVRDVRFMGTNGTMMSGLLYVPRSVTNQNPAPGIIATHGYINSRETQDGFAIEFARRGYVVLALDQTGHGFSDPPAFGNGFGGPDGLRYLRTLDIVDPNNVAMEGHSMGGWASLAAAGALPDGYRSLVLEGSSTGAPFAAEGTTTYPRNLAVVFSEWDEFSTLMWGVPRGKDIVNSDKLKTLFGTTEPVEVGRLYGSIADGTARRLYIPRGTHPNDHISTEAIGNAIEWIQMTLQGGNGLPPSDQIWYWKEIGNFIALLGMVLFMFPLGALLLRTVAFRDLAEPIPASRGVVGGGWWIAAALTIAIPAITYFWLQNTGNRLFPAGPFWPQTITTGIAAWAAGNGLISLVLFLLWHFQVNRKTGATAENYGVTWNNRLDWRRIGKSLLLAICIIVPAYLLLVLSDWLFKTDFRLWVLAIKPMSPLHFRIFLSYVIPFTFFFLVLGTVLHGQLRQSPPDGAPVSLRRALLVNIVLLIAGIVILLLIQYLPLMSGGTLPLEEPLLTIVAFQFVPLLTIVALISTYFYRKTGHIYVGAFLNAMFITWVIVAGQAIQYPL